MKKRVLVIDDEVSLRLALRDVLESAGYSVTTVASGSEGLMRARCHDYDLIITDMIMPGMQGSELIARLRSGGFDMPIIAITGHPEAEACLAIAEKFTVDCIMHKPFTIAKICKEVERLIRSRNPHIQRGKSSPTPME